VIEQKARVTKVLGDKVELECALNSTCSGCSNESNCGVGTVAKAFSGKTQQIVVNSSLIVSPGQWVTIATVEQNLLLHAFVTYLFPLLGLLVAGSIGQYLLVEVLVLPEWLAIVTSFVGGFASYKLGKNVIARLDDNIPVIEIIGVDYS